MLTLLVLHGAVGSLDEIAAVAAGCLVLFGLTFAYTRKRSD
jgi:hypothetical protein